MLPASAPSFSIKSTSPEQTLEIGKIVGSLVEQDTVITLSGNLGTGKTWLAKGIAYGLGVPDHEYVNSPAYDLVHEYSGRLKVYHVDLYRLDALSTDDLLMIQDFYHSGGVCLIEWPARLERYPAAYPSQYLSIHMESSDMQSVDSRQITFSAKGDVPMQLLDRISQKLQS